MIDYATLPRTPSGALTAASKRALEAERQEQDVKLREQYKRNVARWALVAELVDASDALEAFDVVTDNERPETNREDRAFDRGYEQGRVDGAKDAVNDLSITALNALDRAEHRIATLALDTEMTTLELIERLRREIAA